MSGLKTHEGSAAVRADDPDQAGIPADRGEGADGGAAEQAIRDTGTSLRERMAQRREELSRQTTEIFPVPRWADVLAVELRPIPWEDSEQIMRRHIRTPKRMSLNSAADEIIKATVSFYEIKDDGALEEVEGEIRWSTIAKGIIDLPEDVPPQVAERAALLELCDSQGVMALSASYRMWLGGANTGISDQLRRDFQETT